MGLRAIEGFVCVAVVETRVGRKDVLIDRQIFFGLPVAKEMIEEGYESIATNHLVPFAKIEEAKSAQIKLRKREGHDQPFFKEVWIGKLKMEMAESDDENRDPFFEDFNSFVVVMQLEMGWKLVGKITDKRINLYPCPGADLFENGLVPFDNIKPALYTQNDSQRQSWTRCRLATFSLERVTG